MSDSLKVVSSTDDSVVYWDFYDQTGANPYGVRCKVRSFDWGEVQGADTLFELPDRGARLVDVRDPVISSSFVLRLTSDSYANLAAGWGELSRIMRTGEGKALLWLPDGEASTERKYADWLTGSVSDLLKGKDASYQSVVHRGDAIEVVVSVDRQPWWRGVELDSSVNKLPNPTLLLDSDLNGRPDSWTWDTVPSSESINATTEAYRFTFATASARNLSADTAAATAAPSDVWSFSFYAKAVSGTTARARAVVRFLDNTGTPIGSETAGTLTALTTTEGRISVTSAAAPASTDRVRVSIRFENSDAASNVDELRLGQAEKASAVTKWVPGARPVPNDPSDSGGRVYPIFVHGNQPAPVKIKVTGDSGSAIQEILYGALSDYGVRGKNYLTDYLNATKFVQLEATGNGWTVTLSGDTAVQADTDGSPNGTGNTTALTSYTSNPTVMAKRIRATRTTKLDSLRGTWDCYARVKATVDDLHTLQLRWGPSTADPAAYTLDSVSFEPAGSTTFSFVDVYLGRIAIPTDPDVTLGGVAFELWSKSEDTSARLRWDFLAFVPVPEQARVETPGGSSETFLGSELVTPTNPTGLGAGTVSGTNLVMNATNEAGGVAPVGGRLLGAGTHIWTFHTTEFLNPGDGVDQITFRIRNITDSSTAVSRTFTASFVDPSQHSLVLSLPSGTHATTDLYQEQVILTARTAPFQWTFGRIEHSVNATLAANESARTTPEMPAAEKLDSASAFLVNLSVDGEVPFWLPPGLNLIYLHYGDTKVDAASPGQNSVLTRDCTVSVEYAPRWAV